MSYLWILLIVSLVVSAVGWKYFIYFLSIGQGFGIAALAVTIATIFRTAITPATAVAAFLMCVFGCRLGSYLVLREQRSKAYNKILHDPSLEKKKPLGVIISVWLFCALLYVGQVSPLAFRLANGAADNVWAWIAVALMACGIALEAAADAQKSKANRVNPGRFVDIGLYRIVRCPNYLVELTIWTGVLLLCVGADCDGVQWLIAALGYLGIVYVMFRGARRLELRLQSSYGNDSEYQAYISRTPILLPLVPNYSLAKYKWLQA